MAALDYNLALQTVIAAALLANPVLANGAKPGNRIFERVSADFIARRNVHRAPADYLEIKLETSLGRPERMARTSTPTFGQGRTSVADAILPFTVPFDLTLTYDPARWEKEQPAAGAPETEARAALMVNYPRLGGLNYINSFTIERQRSQAATPGGKTVIVERIAFELRLHASQLRN